MGEFELIARYFTRPHLPQRYAQVQLGAGDDCALLQPPAGESLAISTDTLVSGVHFFADVAPRTLGHKALAVNLSDLAAMGARPLGFTLALTLPQLDEAWLAKFAQGLHALADAHACPLIGGDTTRGPLAIGITVLGSVPSGMALRRSGAKVGDDVYISATAQDCIGQARAGLAIRLGDLQLSEHDTQHALARLECPSPRLALGLALRGVASSCLDVSDGLLGDLQHILRASGVGAVVDSAALLNMAAACPVMPALTPAQCLDFLCHGGDDYELLFTAAPSQAAAVAQAAHSAGCIAVRIGKITAAGQGLHMLNAQGQALAVSPQGYTHF
jgi:thiamine-monophosphate kinase